MALKDALEVLFWPASENNHIEEPFFRGGGDIEDGKMEEGNPKDDDTDSRRLERLESKADNNTTRAIENRKRIVRIDERTAYIARIVFALFISFVASVGAGLALGITTL